MTSDGPGWADLVRAEPAFASAVRAAFSIRKHCTLATLRRDGSPRISGIEVEFTDEDVVIGMMAGSVKAADVLRDPRVALHSPTVDPPDDDPSAWAGEAKLSGRLDEVAGRADDGPPGHRFRLTLTEASVVRVAPSGDHLLIDAWRPSGGVRRLERH